MLITLLSSCSGDSSNESSAAQTADIAPSNEPSNVEGLGSAPNASEIPPMKIGEAYSAIREKLLKAGWKPMTTGPRDECSEFDDRCSGFPEAVSCAGSGQAPCKFSWKSDSRTMFICTVGENPKFASTCDEKMANSPSAKDSVIYKKFEDYITSCAHFMSEPRYDLERAVFLMESAKRECGEAGKIVRSLNKNASSNREVLKEAQNLVEDNIGGELDDFIKVIKSALAAYKSADGQRILDEENASYQ